MTDGPWEGLSLRYVRTLLGKPPEFADANQAREASGDLRGGIPPTGGVCWYRTNRYGNVALSIGEVETSRPMVICVRRGWPALRYYDDTVLGEYLGWTETIGEPHPDPDPH